MLEEQEKGQASDARCVLRWGSDDRPFYYVGHPDGYIEWSPHRSDAKKFPDRSAAHGFLEEHPSLTPRCRVEDLNGMEVFG